MIFSVFKTIPIVLFPETLKLLTIVFCGKFMNIFKIKQIFCFILLHLFSRMLLFINECLVCSSPLVAYRTSTIVSTLYNFATVGVAKYLNYVENRGMMNKSC